MPTQTSLSAVAMVFQNVFGRVPTSQESSAWAAQLDSGSTTAQLAAVLAGSPEGAAQVSNLYQQVLGRSSTGVSGSEIANGQAYLAQDQTNGLSNLRTSMASSPEVQADIKALYQNVLGRAASSGEISNAETALANGATLANLYSSAAASPELTANLAVTYKSAFGTAPSAAVVAFLQQQIAGGAGFSQLATALSSQAGNSGGGTATPAVPQITSVTQDAVGSGYVDIGGTGQPGASISASVTTTTLGTPQTVTSPFASAAVDASGKWSVTNAPSSGGSGADQAIPNGTYAVTPVETVNGQAIAGTATSITLSSSGLSISSGISISDTFNPAESMVASASASGAARTATTSTAASGASFVQLTNPATAGIIPTLHS